MLLYSTNNHTQKATLKDAVLKGLPEDNGLFMPVNIPLLPADFFDKIHTLSFQEIAFKVAGALVGNAIPEEALGHIVEEAINFDAPVVNIHDHIYALELFHGPTLAFKDFGARFMARLMAYLLQGDDRQINILVATSGDTGSAVAQGFLGVPGIKVTILYPAGKVSDIQEKQLTTLGENITALEVDGTFDDCQRLVKQAFLDQALNKEVRLTSANSINIGRLIPQSFYYFYAFAQLKLLNLPLVFSVPSGNFGNLCGGLIAKQMGLPVDHFIAATNINDVVPQYLQTGEFVPRPSQKTISNAMDVGNPSNFSRMKDLYKLNLDAIRGDISGTTVNDIDTRTSMREVYRQYQYVLDPHGAVAYHGLTRYLGKTDKEVAGVLLATAHPAKFIDVVEKETAQKITLPERLKAVLNKEKQAIPMDNDYGQLKAFLKG